MKNIFKLLYVFIALSIAFVACTPDEYSLGTSINKSDLKFSIVPNASDPNMIILKSLTPNATPLWVTPSGRSTRVEDTVKIAFPGVYKFVYGVESNAGLVQADTVVINITTSNLSYVNDPLWTMLSGGAGNQKTWYLDLDAESVCRYFAGPLFFYGTADSWESVTNGTKISGDSWNWCPGYKDNSWLMAAADYGSMTFDLKNGAHITVNHKALGKMQTGTYLLDASSHTLKITDAGILHDSGRDGVVLNWGNLKVLSLTENTMQLAALRDASLSGESACLLVYNFISKDYYDNWKPVTLTYSEPVKTSFTKDDLVGTWKYSINSQNWVGWEAEGSNAGGKLVNNWTTRSAMIADLTSWGASDAASVFSAADNNLYTFNEDGTCALNGVANTYSVNKGVITFGTPLAGTEWNLVWLSLTGSSVKVLNVTTIGTSTYKSNGIWIGTQNGDKNEDQAVQLIKQ